MNTRRKRLVKHTHVCDYEYKKKTTCQTYSCLWMWIQEEMKRKWLLFSQLKNRCFLSRKNKIYRNISGANIEESLQCLQKFIKQSHLWMPWQKKLMLHKCYFRKHFEVLILFIFSWLPRMWFRAHILQALKTFVKDHHKENGFFYFVFIFL